MRLHRLELTNYRGIKNREIVFPDDGVVVVSGPNEIGKSSMIEALDLLVEAKDRSSKKDVKQVQPTNADVGAEVTAEISTGSYRFIYHKRFHKRPETTLTVLEPHREQLTGDQAHERVAAILAETVDAGLWRAQRVLQATSTDSVELSGCDALSRALDIAAGDTASLTGTETQLIERIDSEYLRYFTKTGRATGEWAAAKGALAESERQVEHWAAAVADVENRVVLHAELTDQFAELDRQHGEISARYDAARLAAEEVGALTNELREEKLKAGSATTNRDRSKQAHAERVRLAGEIDTRTVALADLEPEIEQVTAAATAATAEHVAVETVLQQVTGQLESAQHRERTARRIVDRLSELAEADRLAGQLNRCDEARRGRDDVAGELAGIILTEAMLRDIENAHNAAELSAAQLSAISATVEITAAANVDLMVGDQPLALGAGEAWSTSAPTAIAIPGLLTVRVSAGDVARAAQDKHAAARQQLTTALAAGQVADLATARTVDARRRELQGRRDQLDATLKALSGNDDPDVLRDRETQLRAAQLVDAELVGTDSVGARAQLEAASEALSQAAKDCDSHRAVVAAAVDIANEKSTRAKVLQGTIDTQRAELASVAQRLAAERQSTADEVLADCVAADETAVQVAEQRVAELSAKLAATEPEVVDVEFTAATAAVAQLRSQCEETDRNLNRVTAELDVLGREGRQSKLDAAQTEHEHAAAGHAAIGRRARAAELLRSVMLRHRDDTRKRYVEPFRAEIQRLGRLVFGPSFEVEIDSELRIVNRTLDGCTVPYESLSGGAKEQLGILTRLAGAALVAKEDTVPVLIDDALGFTDPDRLIGMGAVFDAVGARGQVIVLTCSPDRYQSIGVAHRIELNA